MIKLLLPDGSTKLVSEVEYEELRALNMEKRGDFRENESRSDFDMTKKANLEVLGAENFFVGADNSDKLIIGKITMGSYPETETGANYGKDKF